MKVNGSQVSSCVGGVMAAILFACSLRTYMYVYRYTERMDDSVNRIEFYVYIYIHDDPSPQCCTKFFYYVMWQGFLELQPLKISLQHSPLKSQNLEPIWLYIIYLIINFNKKTRIIPKNLAYINSRATRNNPKKTHVLQRMHSRPHDAYASERQHHGILHRTAARARGNNDVP